MEVVRAKAACFELYHFIMFIKIPCNGWSDKIPVSAAKSGCAVVVILCNPDILDGAYAGTRLVDEFIQFVITDQYAYTHRRGWLCCRSNGHVSVEIIYAFGILPECTIVEVEPAIDCIQCIAIGIDKTDELVGIVCKRHPLIRIVPVGVRIDHIRIKRSA